MMHGGERHAGGKEKLREVAGLFAAQGRVLEVHPFGQGNINDTFLVTLDYAPAPRFILQRLNTRVFRQPRLVMGNLRLVTEHVRRRLPQAGLSPDRRWEMPRLLPTAQGADCHIDSDGGWWRALSFIDGAESHETLAHAGQAREVGYALGLFHHLVNDLSPGGLADTLPGFHVTPRYLQHFDEVKATRPPRQSPEVRQALAFIEARREQAAVLESARASGKLRQRPMHGDPKVNNVLMDTVTGQAVSLVDLDTVKPGLIHYDVGDCLRSAANPLGEETEAWQQVRFEAEIARALLQGYVSPARAFLTPADYDYLYDAVRLLAFELGLRFFTDFLEGNVYFKARHAEHNLARALVQFALTRSIEAQEPAIRAIIRDLA